MWGPFKRYRWNEAVMLCYKVCHKQLKVFNFSNREPVNEGVMHLC